MRMDGRQRREEIDTSERQDGGECGEPGDCGH